MIGRLLVEQFRSGELLLPDFLAQVEARFTQAEPSILALIPEEKRFDRLNDEADALVLSYPDLINRPLMFGALLGAKDIFHVEGFPTRAGSRLPADVFSGKGSEKCVPAAQCGRVVFWQDGND